MMSGESETVVVRNSEVTSFLMATMAMFCGIMSVGLVALVLTGLFYKQISGTATCAVVLFILLRSIPRLWRIQKARRFARAELTPAALKLRLGTVKDPASFTLPWKQIAAITKRKENRSPIYVLTLVGGQ